MVSKVIGSYIGSCPTLASNLCRLEFQFCPLDAEVIAAVLNSDQTENFSSADINSRNHDPGFIYN